MSRSRRPLKREKCICGRSLVRLRGEQHHGRPVTGCPVLDAPHEHNDERRRFKRRRDNIRAPKETP